VDHNPYSPPSAPVADPPSIQPMERPITVTIAVRLLWLMTGLSTVGGVILMSQVAPPFAIAPWFIPLMVVVYCAGLALVWWIFGAVAKGRNWARIVVAVFGAISLFNIWITTRAVLPQTDWMRAGLIVRSAFWVVAAILLFVPKSRPWFAPRD
jgi:hypothetical protein